MCVYFRLKEIRQRDKSQTETSWNLSSNKTTDTLNNVKPLSIYNSIVPYIDSDRDDSDDSDNTLSVIRKLKHLKDQKVPDKKPLVMRPKEDPDDNGVATETTPKKCLVLKPQNDDSPVVERENLFPKKCLVLKPKDDDEPLEVKTEQECVKKCLVRIPKDDFDSKKNNEKNVEVLDIYKTFYSIERKDSGKKHRRHENGSSEFDNNKLKIRLEHNNHNE